MPTETLSFRDTGYFSSLICDYVEANEAISNLYNRFPTLEAFKGQITEKSQSFKDENRAVLVDVLKVQYSDINASDLTMEHIESLLSSKTFTVTTGHQLNLFTGPLYFLHKIISVVNLAKSFSEKYPDNQFVPIFWMASEDHDFEEISYFNFRGRKVRWNKESAGAV
ncbi:MAG: bacillithiol biosynthesis BshC, partial [Bacteroidota bacterium]